MSATDDPIVKKTLDALRLVGYDQVAGAELGDGLIGIDDTPNSGQLFTEIMYTRVCDKIRELPQRQQRDSALELMQRQWSSGGSCRWPVIARGIMQRGINGNVSIEALLPVLHAIYGEVSRTHGGA